MNQGLETTQLADGVPMAQGCGPRGWTETDFNDGIAGRNQLETLGSGVIR